MYLLCSSFAETSAGGARNQAHKTKRNVQELEAFSIRCAGESVCLYRLRGAQVNGPRCLFSAAPRKAKRMLFTPAVAASSMQRIQRATSRRASFENDADAFRARRGAVIFDDLRAIQLRHGFLPKAELEGLSQRTQTPLYQIHSVASFYPHFHLVPPPKAEIRVCADMSCHLNGACELRADLESRFANSRTEDVQIRDVSCLGRCDHAPAISVNDHIFTDVTSGHAEQLARSAIRGDDMNEPHPEQARIVCKADPYGDGEKYGVVRKLIQSLAWDDVLAQLKAAELKGMGGAGFPTSMKWDLDYDLEVFVSPGGYICGEESALIEAIEGHRAEPRNKPPFPGQVGLWQKPTVINNVETFINVPQILARGADWFAAQGANGSRGLKFVGVSGHVAQPGVFEVPMGTPMREVIFKYAGGVRRGGSLKAFAPSGPSSGYLPASMVDVRLDFKALADAGSMLGSGAIVVCDNTTCMLDMALNAVRFYRNESCGKCVPCRVGSQKMTDLLVRWTQGSVSEPEYRADLTLLDDLSQAMSQTSICGLGQIAPAPIQSVLKHFRAEVDAHVLKGQCPSGICFTAASRAGEVQRVGIRP